MNCANFKSREQERFLGNNPFFYCHFRSCSGREVGRNAQFSGRGPPLGPPRSGTRPLFEPRPGEELRPLQGEVKTVKSGAGRYQMAPPLPDGSIPTPAPQPEQSNLFSYFSHAHLMHNYISTFYKGGPSFSVWELKRAFLFYCTRAPE